MNNQYAIIRAGGVLILFVALLTGTVRAQLTYYSTGNAVVISGYNGSPTNLVIPSTTNGYPVTGIANNAFQGKSTLKSVTIPNSVTSIGNSAFFACTSLTSVTIPPSVATITNATFDSCYNLADVMISEGVTSIGFHAFEYCGLTSLTIPNSVTNIGDSSFYSCQSLTNVTIGKSLVKIQSNAFAFCNNLSSVYFQGNAPSPTNDASVFSGIVFGAKAYYLPGTSGWGTAFDGLACVLWNPQAQTDGADFGVRTNRFGFNITASTNVPIVVEVCTNPANPGWTPLFTGTVTNGSFYFCDAKWTNYPVRYYRIRSP